MCVIVWLWILLIISNRIIVTVGTQIKLWMLHNKVGKIYYVKTIDLGSNSTQIDRNKIKLPFDYNKDDNKNVLIKKLHWRLWFCKTLRGADDIAPYLKWNGSVGPEN